MLYLAVLLLAVSSCEQKDRIKVPLAVDHPLPSRAAKHTVKNDDIPVGLDRESLAPKLERKIQIEPNQAHPSNTGNQIERAVCNNKDLETCHSLGWSYQKRGLYQKARSYYESSCASGLAKSCNNLGFLAEEAGDFSNARDLYRRACSRKHHSACSSMERVRLKMTGSTH